MTTNSDDSTTVADTNPADTSLTPSTEDTQATVVEGRLPDGTGYRITFGGPFAPGSMTGRSAAIIVDLNAEQAALIDDCANPCSPVIGIVKFLNGTQAEPEFAHGSFLISSGEWTMSVGLYEHITELWGQDTERMLTESIVSVASDSNPPAFTLHPPLRWANDTEIPLQMEIQYEMFVVRRGCGELSIACSPSMAVQVIPAESVFAPAPKWDHNQLVTVEDK